MNNRRKITIQDYLYLLCQSARISKKQNASGTGCVSILR